MGTYFVGLDLGQRQDYSALVVLELDVRPLNGKPSPMVRHLAVRHAERPALGTSYLTIVARVKELLAMPPLRGATHLVADATGVGSAVVDLLRHTPLPVRSCRWVTITGGDKVSYDNGTWRVPKRDLVGVVQVLLQGSRLKIAEGLPLARILTDELLGFQVRITESGHDQYGVWREGVHDDLVLATALACWLGDQSPAPKPTKTPYRLGSDVPLPFGPGGSRRPRHWSETAPSIMVRS